MRAQRGMQAFGGLGRTLSKEDELSALKSQAEYLKNELDAVQAQVQNLETK
jgi:allophanate hydrolase subunit 2